MKMPKFALVTGAGRRLGREIAFALSRTTAGVAVHYYKNKTAAEKTVRLIKERGNASFAVPADLTKEKEAARLIATVEKKYGRLDILINNIGPILMKSWDELDADDWERMFRTNLLSAYFCLKAALPGMRKRKWGRVVNIGYSRAEQIAAYPAITAYAAAKTGLLILTRTAAAAEAGSGITVNMVSPGLLEGCMLPQGLESSKTSLGTFSDVANAVCFLASEEARAITGTHLVVAGTWKM